MSRIQLISNAEKQIMEIIWRADHPITTSQILQQLPKGKTWKPSTVVTFLNRLMAKGVLKATRISKANYYEPCISEQEYLAFETKQFIKDVHKGSVFGFVTALCDSGDLTKEDIELLMKRLKEQDS